MKNCSNCGKEILEKAVCCPYCGAQQKMEEHAENNTENVKKIRYCTGCGEKLEEDYGFCPTCGKPINNRYSKQKTETGSGNSQNGDRTGADKNSGNTDSKPEPGRSSGTSAAGMAEDIREKIRSTSAKYPQGLLKVFSIVFGILYGYWTLTYFPYLNYYMAADKAWGFFMILACAWSCAAFFIIAFKCQKQYGLQLAYLVFGGAILKSILHLISIQRLAAYQYWESSFSNYWPIIFALLIAFACYYLMKKEDMLEVPEGVTFMENVKRIPDVLRFIFSKDGTVKMGENPVHKDTNKAERPHKDPVKPGSEAEKVVFVINNSVFLIFGILYTVNLVCNVFYSFSFFKLLTSLFTILTCVAIWIIYSNGRKGVLDATGFSMICGINTFRLGVRVLISVLILIGAISAELGAGIYFLIFIIALLDLGYWYSIGNTFSSMKANAKGQMVEVTAGIYPIIILCINTVIKLGILGWASFLQSTANGITSTLNQYGNTTSSLFGELSSYLGFGYGYGYSQSSSIVQAFLNPIIEWIQNTLGFSGQSFIIMLIAVALPVLEIILLVRVRSYMNARN